MDYVADLYIVPAANAMGNRNTCTDGQAHEQIDQQSCQGTGGTHSTNGNTATKGNVLVEGNSDIIGNLNADGDVCINTTIEAKGGNLTIDGTQIKMNGMTATGAKPFNGFPGGSDTFTGAPVSQDTVMGNGSLAGGNAENNKDSYYSDSEDGGGE